MPETLKIENIEHMRQLQGIDDVELRESIRRLRIGDCVHLTFLSGSRPVRSKTVPVRIVAIDKDRFTGEIMESLTSLGQDHLRERSLVTFQERHVHSIPKLKPEDSP